MSDATPSHDPKQSTAEGHAVLRLLDRPLTPGDIHDATQRVAQSLQPPVTDTSRLLMFWIASERLLLPAADVMRVTPKACVRRIPHRSNRVLRGLCNINGQLLLCADLRRLLELPDDDSRPDTDHRMVVLGRHEPQWVVEVDAVEGIVQVDSDTGSRPPITVEEAVGRYTLRLVSLSPDSQAAILDSQGLFTGFEAALS